MTGRLGPGGTRAGRTFPPLPLRAWQERVLHPVPGTGSRAFWAPHPDPPPASRLSAFRCSLQGNFCIFPVILARGAAPAAPCILRRPPPPDQEAEPVLQGPPRPPALGERKLRPRGGQGPQQGGQSRGGRGEGAHGHLPCSALRWSVIQSTNSSPDVARWGAGRCRPAHKATNPRSPWGTRAAPAAAGRASAHSPSSSRAPLGPDRGGETPLQRLVGSHRGVGAGAREGLGSWRVSRGGCVQGSGWWGGGAGSCLQGQGRGGGLLGGTRGLWPGGAQGPQVQPVGSPPAESQVPGGGAR